MPLNKEVLGLGLYNALKVFNDKNPTETGDLEEARLNFCEALAEEVIDHIKTNAVVTVNVVTSGTATNHTGTGTGTIS